MFASTTGNRMLRSSTPARRGPCFSLLFAVALFLTAGNLVSPALGSASSSSSEINGEGTTVRQKKKTRGAMKEHQTDVGASAKSEKDEESELDVKDGAGPALTVGNPVHVPIMAKDEQGKKAGAGGPEEKNDKSSAQAAAEQEDHEGSKAQQKQDTEHLEALLDSDPQIRAALKALDIEQGRDFSSLKELDAKLDEKYKSKKVSGMKPADRKKVMDAIDIVKGPVLKEIRSRRKPQGTPGSFFASWCSLVLYLCMVLIVLTSLTFVRAKKETVLEL